MQRATVLTITSCLLLLTGATADEAADALAKAVRETTALRGYTFKIEGEPAPGPANTVVGKYEKGQPISFTADKIEFYKKGDVVVYKDADKWQRSKTGTESDPLRILGGVAKVRGARLPHEELPDLVKVLKDVKQGEAGPDKTTAYTGTLDEEGAKKLAPPSMRSVAQNGKATLWVGADGQVHKYAYTIRVQGRLGNAEIDGMVGRTATLTDRGAARVEVPEAAKKALE